MLIAGVVEEEGIGRTVVAGWGALVQEIPGPEAPHPGRKGGCQYSHDLQGWGGRSSEQSLQHVVLTDLFCPGCHTASEQSSLETGLLFVWRVKTL